VKIAVAASPEVAIPTLEYLFTSEHDLALVISRPDSQVGRGRELTPTAVSNWAKEKQVDLYCPNKAADFDERLKDFDLVITIGYGLILPKALLIQPKFGFINLHFSLLPKLRGAAPAQRAIIEGLKQTGVTVFQLDEGMDTGPIYVRREFEIEPGMTAGDLLSSLALLGPEVIAEALTAIERGDEPIAQDDEQASLAAKLTKAEARIDWSKASEEIVNKILGFAPNPGTTTLFRGEIIRITKARVSTKRYPKGNLTLTEGRVFVGTADNAIELQVVTPAGKKQMDAVAWANGARFKAGEVLE